MKIPKYIDEALSKRRKAAMQLSKYDAVVSDFIIKNQIDVDTQDYGGGVEMYSNPSESEQTIRKAILNHNKRKETLR